MISSVSTLIPKFPRNPPSLDLLMTSFIQKNNRLFQDLSLSMYLYVIVMFDFILPLLLWWFLCLLLLLCILLFTFSIVVFGIPADANILLFVCCHYLYFIFVILPINYEYVRRSDIPYLKLAKRKFEFLTFWKKDPFLSITKKKIKLSWEFAKIWSFEVAVFKK